MRVANLMLSALLATCAITVPAHAADADANASVDAKDTPLDPIRAQQIDIRADVLAGEGQYADMNEFERRELASKQTELLEILAGKEFFSELSQDEQFEAFNTLQWIKAAVTGDESQRVVCEYVPRTGSRIGAQHCATVAERRDTREDAKQLLISLPECMPVNGNPCRQ